MQDLAPCFFKSMTKFLILPTIDVATEKNIALSTWFIKKTTIILTRSNVIADISPPLASECSDNVFFQKDAKYRL